MKNKVLKMVVLAISLPLLFSSCLGTANNGYEIANDFVYIEANENGGTYAMSLNGVPMIFSQMAAMEVGTCLVMSYKITEKNNNGIYYNAENVNISKTIRNDEQTKLLVGAPVIEDTVAVNTVFINSYSPRENVGDRWLFSGAFPLKKDESMGYAFYYNRSAQYDERGPVEGNISAENKLIIDIVFTKINPNAGSAVVDNTTKSFVANLSRIRAEYNPPKPVTTEGALTPVLVKFRYYSKGVAKPYYIGSWSESAGKGFYFDKK